MELGSDGSLCPITCSAAEHNNVVVVPESELEKSKRPPYKILFLGIIQNPYESSSETESDEEICKKVPGNIEESNINNEGNANTSSDKKPSRNAYKDKRSPKADKNYNKQKPSKSFKNRRPNSQYNRFKKPRNSLNKRNSYPQNASGTIYSNTSCANIEPWAINPQIMLPNYPYHVYPQFPVTPAIEPHIPKTLNNESSAKSVGLLGASPYENYQFPPPKQNVSDQNYWKDPTNMHDQNYWSNSHYDNYQRPVSKTNLQHRKSYQQNGYRQWGNRRGNAHKWNKTKDPNDRGMNTGHYTYDH